MKSNERNWYAMKVFFNKVFEMETLLEGHGLECYLAVEKVLLKGEDHLAAARKLALDPSYGKPDNRFIREGALIYRRQPMVSSLLFVCTDAAGLQWLEKLLKDAADAGRAIGFLYRTADWKTLAVIPAKQMEIFRLVTSAGTGGLDFFADDDITRFKQGSRVRVKEGPLKGAEGYIKRIRRDRRLLVSIEGVIAVATSYIPPEQLEIIPEE